MEQSITCIINNRNTLKVVVRNIIISLIAYYSMLQQQFFCRLPDSKPWTATLSNKEEPPAFPYLAAQFTSPRII